MKSRCLSMFIFAVIALQPFISYAQHDIRSANTMSFVFRDAPVAELFEMLSRKERVNIMLTPGVTGKVTVNLYDISLRQAIYAIAEAAGYSVEERGGGYVILDKRDGARRPIPGGMEVRAMRVQYSNPRMVADIVSKYSSPEGKVTLLEERKTLILEDSPAVLARMERLLREVDKEPTQIMIEAKILEVMLDDTQNFGIDWTRVFNSGGVDQLGTKGLANRASPGLFFNLVNRNIDVYLSALSNKGKIHTLATPKLLTLENQEAVTNVGDKIGYRLTTTINNVTTESIQFLETGVILRVVPSVDVDGRISMKIRPEVSSGSVTGGIPSKKTTEVTTQLIAQDGQSVLIAGLIKNSAGYRRTGVPLLADIPGVGRLFSSTESIGVATETIVLITPRIVKGNSYPGQEVSLNKVSDVEHVLEDKKVELEDTLGKLTDENE